MNNIRYFLSITFILFTFGFEASSSQTSGPETVFWEINGNGLEQPSYLFGTIHIMPKSQFTTYKMADEKLKESEQLVMEMKIDVPLKTQMEWAQKMLLPEGKTIPDYMDEEEYARVEAYAMDSLEIKKFLFNTYIKMKPLAFYSALIPHVIGKKIEGYDMYFSNIAKKEEIPVVGLESFEFQLAIFDSIPYEKQLDMFFPEENFNFKNELQELIDIYLSHDIYQMAEEFSKEEARGYKELESELLIKRNMDWVEKISEIIIEKSSFIAVGAGHLAGDQGLIQLLRQKGFTLTPIMLNEN
ncbi:MAG: TraB/GumN family protein [Bacteroidota bacterium]